MKISDEIRNWCEFEDGTECGGFVTKASFDKLCALADRIDSEMMELPKDADGVPIHVGETVYGEDGRAWHVEGISLGRWAKWVEGHVVHAMGDSGQWRDLIPEWLTHERPDSWERIADELLAWCDDVDVDGDGDGDACDVPRGIAVRIRKLAKKEGE